jgi:serine/threonine protein kinase/predicted ATPase
MKPQRWEQISQIFRTALEREPAERPVYLAAACSDDDSLRREVDALIASHEEAGDFIASPALEMAAPLFADEPVELQTGQMIGPYQIVTTIGAGGMGKVYLAEDTRLKRKVALKLLPASFSHDDDRERRFEQEARSASALNHPNILTIYEIGLEDGARFIATEFIEGETLRERMRRAPVGLREALDVAIQVASALTAAHAARIMHRDIKPENIMVRTDGYVKVLDFGLAKLTEAEKTPLDDTDSLSRALVNTEPGMVMGTVSYMSPEQARGLEVDARTDIWSLGVVLYEMIAGHAPFRGPTQSDVLAAILMRDAQALTEAAGHGVVPPELERIVTKALAKDREERYQTIRDALTDLRRLKQRLEFEIEMRRSDPSSREWANTGALLAPTALEPPPEQQPSSERRKQVTVLCADLSDLTARFEAGDAEEVSELMTGLWERLDAVVADHGGAIERRMGDAMVALWSAEVAHEDDPERAIRAALAMQAEGREFIRGNLSPPLPESDEGVTPLEADDTAAPLMSVGINTGLALVGAASGARGERSATGAAINVASRLERAAPRTGIYISGDTYRHVRGVFDVQPVELMAASGKPEPLFAYLVERAKPRAFRLRTRGVEGIETRMIGRQAELERLLNALSAVLEDRELQVVTVVGEAGLGKSRLLYEFSSEVELLPERFRIFNGRASEAMKGLPYSLVRDVFFFRFEIQDSDSPAVAREKLEQGMRPFFGAGEEAAMRAHFIGHLIGLDFSASPHLRGIIDDAKQIRDRAFHYATQFFTAVARDLPAIIYLDDLHWADDGSLDFAEHIARTCSSSPLLLLCFARPQLLERRVAWGEGEAAHARVQLQPLLKRESRQLVEEILRQAESIPQALRELIVSGAEGNPFYVEELIKMLIDQKVILPGQDRWHVDASRLVEVRVPSTLTGVLQARLDSLSVLERTVLQRASVVGRIFWGDAVERLRIEPTSGAAAYEGSIREALEALRRKELVYRREASAFVGTTEYIFKHAILRDVTYESVLKRDRRRYHREFAAWLSERAGERAGEYAGTIAQHYELAKETGQAAEWYGRAAQQAREAYAPETAASYYRKALEFLPVAEAETDAKARRALQKEWYQGLGEVLKIQARFDKAIEAIEAMRAVAEVDKDTVAQARAWNELAVIKEKRGDNRAALESARRAEKLARAAGADASAELTFALVRQGWALYRLGDGAAVTALAQQALALSAAMGDSARRERARSLALLGAVHVMTGRFDEAYAFFEQSLGLFRELDDRRNVGVLLDSLGETARLRGDYAAAVARFEEALTIAREIGERVGQMTYLSNLGGALIGLEDYAGAEDRLRAAIALVGASGYNGLSETHRFLAEACLGEGKTAEALEAAKAALTVGQQTGNQEFVGGAWRALGLVAARLREAVSLNDRIYEPSACFAESLRVFTEVGMEAERARTLRDWASYEKERGDSGRGLAMWQEAREIFSRLGIE